jgi:PHD/YefM family antitoxin component YafN of YafNO toxin-antitoxin module
MAKRPLTCPISEFRMRLRELITSVEVTGTRVLIVRHGMVAAMLVPPRASKAKRIKVYKTYSMIRRKARCSGCKRKARRR